ncbi:hypothetical protein [Sphingomonas sp. BK069]|uniref:hypothetical protein n=1 Tax=Sphingomonas sp. BK069 TaxID=2586979 RepID=UPI001607566D|nr:hypothetical protein [Sphingomonas sp. BK069]MBB3349276.1 hypothetical protein [Sphingomonas sp. BK069]
MVAYRIDKDLTISRVDDHRAEMKACGWAWDCLDYDDTNDVWCNDWGLTEPDLVFAWIGRARRVPLPAYILGVDGEDSCDPHLAIEDVRFGSERYQARWPLRVSDDGNMVVGFDPREHPLPGDRQPDD